MIPIHPARTDHPQTMRWIVGPGTLAVRGPMRAVPRPLQSLIDDGCVIAVTVEPAAVLVTLADDRSWTDDGPAVRTALHAALAEPGEWLDAGPAVPSTGEAGMPAAAGAGPGNSDADLEQTARRLLAGEIGDVAASHGGSIQLVGVSDGVVTVRLRGACHGCPAAGFTLHHRLEAALREVHPDLVRVDSVGGSDRSGDRGDSARVWVPLRIGRRRA